MEAMKAIEQEELQLQQRKDFELHVTVRKERVSENSTPTETAAVFAPSRFHWQFTNTETGTGNVRTSFQSFRLAFT